MLISLNVFLHDLHVQLDGHGGAEVLAGDWDKYSHPVVATGCADGTVRTWDLRQPR